MTGNLSTLHTPSAAIETGIATVQQHPELVDDLSGVENIFLGLEGRRPGVFSRLDRQELKRSAAKLLERFPVEIDLDMIVGDMAAVDREIVAVLHALRREDIRILILDEPTSTLTEREKASLFHLMRTLSAQGIAIIYITHRLEEVFEIADRFTILRGGRQVATLTSVEARDAGVSITELMLDDKIDELYPRKSDVTPGEVMLEVRGLGRHRLFSDVSFVLRRGEILGLFGLVGSGCDELSKVLFGVMPHDQGELILQGRPVRLKSAREALRRGIFLVPGDRRREGLTLGKDVVFNVTLANLGRASFAAGLLRFGSSRQSTGKLAADVDLQPADLSSKASAFSGGNQQKIVVAKGLYRRADIYIFVEPTVGVDIGARAKLYALIRELSRNAAVLVISSDCDEVHGLADRTMALYKGTLSSNHAGVQRRDQLFAAGIMGDRAA